MDDNLAYSVLSTGCPQAAWVDTLVVDTGRTTGTVKVRLASPFFPRSALHQWVAVGFVNRTLTKRCLSLHNAEGVDATASVRTGVDLWARTETAREWISRTSNFALTIIATDKVLTNCINTTRIVETLIPILYTLRSRVTHIVGRTGTLLSMLDALALGIYSTCIGKET